MLTQDQLDRVPIDDERADLDLQGDRQQKPQAIQTALQHRGDLIAERSQVLWRQTIHNDVELAVADNDRPMPVGVVKFHWLVEVPAAGLRVNAACG
jgi:hypothetical protein